MARIRKAERGRLGTDHVETYISITGTLCAAARRHPMASPGICMRHKVGLISERLAFPVTLRADLIATATLTTLHPIQAAVGKLHPTTDRKKYGSPGLSAWVNTN